MRRGGGGGGVTEKHADGAHARRHAVVHVRQHQPFRDVKGATAAKNKVFSDYTDLKQIKRRKQWTQRRGVIHHLLDDLGRRARHAAAVDVGEVQRAVVQVLDAGGAVCADVCPVLKQDISVVIVPINQDGMQSYQPRRWWRRACGSLHSWLQNP